MIVTIPLSIWVWRSLIRRYETGSRIDLERRLFIWWDGPQPRLENNIELDKIIGVKLVDAGISLSFRFGFLRYHFFGDGNNLELLDIMGNKTTVRGLCVKSTRDWGRAVKSEFPHIHVET